MKRIKEINWEARGAWPEKLLDKYKWVSDQIRYEYEPLLKKNQMLDLESLVILGQGELGYRIKFYIRTMNDNTILGSEEIMVNIPYKKFCW